jgi:hypothetical protein
MPRKGYNTKFKMNAKDLGIITVAAGKAGMIPIDYILKKKVAENEITTKENAFVDEEVSQLTKDTMLELYGGKRKRSDSIDTSGPTPKKSDTRESPTVVLKRWIEEGYDIGFPPHEVYSSNSEGDESDDNSDEPAWRDRKGYLHGNKAVLECHGCSHRALTPKHLMWYDTGDGGTQLCGSCDMIFYDEYIKHRMSNK